MTVLWIIYTWIYLYLVALALWLHADETEQELVQTPYLKLLVFGPYMVLGFILILISELLIHLYRKVIPA